MDVKIYNGFPSDNTSKILYRFPVYGHTTSSCVSISNTHLAFQQCGHMGIFPDNFDNLEEISTQDITIHFLLHPTHYW